MTATMESAKVETNDHGPNSGRGWIVVVAGCIAGALVALLLIPIWPSAGGATSNNVGVTERDFTITLDAAAAHPGTVTFRVSNDGNVAHEFVVFRTAVAADSMPAGTKARFNEDSPLVHNVIDSGGDIAPGHSATFSANLPAGHYVLVCNLPGHYAAGMHADFTVK